MAKEKKYVMAYIINRCIDCKACMISCKSRWDVPGDHFRTHITSGSCPSIPGKTRTHYLPSQCNHCDDPPCVTVCPTKASHKRDDGLVYIDRTICIGCKYCIVSCPYDERFYNEEAGVAEKCTFCFPKIYEGHQPACVETCLGNARFFGDINDEDSEVYKIINEAIKNKQKVWKLRVDLGTEPNIYYIQY